MIVIKDDKLISYSFIIASIINFISKFITPLIWKWYGFYKTYLICNGLALLIYIYYILLAKNNKIFMFLLFPLVWGTLGIFYITCYYTTFNLFHPKIAVNLGKLFDSNYLIGMIMGVIIN